MRPRKVRTVVIRAAQATAANCLNDFYVPSLRVNMRFLECQNRNHEACQRTKILIRAGDKAPGSAQFEQDRAIYDRRKVIHSYESANHNIQARTRRGE